MQKKGTLTGLLVGVLSLLGAGTATAEPVEFTADAVISMPQRGIQSGTLYVGAKGVRMDSLHQGRQVIEVRLPKEGIARVLFPEDKTYLEMKIPAGAGVTIGPQTEPCVASEKIACEKQEAEKTGNADVELWHVTPEGAPKPIKIWWDAKRKLPVRQAFPDGRVIQSIFQNTEFFGDRNVERWEVLFRAPHGRFMNGQVLFDPEYGLTVYESMPGGLVRELRNVRLGAPDAALFGVPEGYKEIKRPQQPQPVAPPAPQGAVPQQGGYGAQPGPYGAAPRYQGRQPAPYGYAPQGAYGRPVAPGYGHPVPPGYPQPQTPGAMAPQQGMSGTDGMSGMDAM